jgi:hypothetical protein
VINNYKLFKYLQDTFSPHVGLVPDFVQNVTKEHIGHPAKKYSATKKYLENLQFDGIYYHNAARVPWRIGLDYILNGNMNAKMFLDTVNSWIRKQTNDEIEKINEGYYLNGNPTNYGKGSPQLMFICPFAVSAMVDKKNQPWLNKLWKYIVDSKLSDSDDYNNTIKMFNMVILSGNYWAPN